MKKKQLLSRLLQMVVVLIGISFFTFLLTYISPGDPVRNMLSATGVMPTEELIRDLRDQMGLNDPFFVQYFRWLGNCLQGDFGTSYEQTGNGSFTGPFMADTETDDFFHDLNASDCGTAGNIVCGIQGFCR